MTCWVVINLIRKMDIDPQKTYVQVSDYASSMIGTTANLRPGQVISIWDLLHALMLPSGNDAAVALAENFGIYLYYESKQYREAVKRNPEFVENFKLRSPISSFCIEMNRWCRVFNMNDTSFANVHGLNNKQNRSTAYDMA